MKAFACASTCLLIGLSACTTLPSVQYQYTPAVGQVAISVVQSLACSTDDETLIIANADPTVTASYMASPKAGPWGILINNDSSDTSDTDFTFTRYDDGRLKGVNSTTTGQGETILKDVISIAGVAALVVGKAPGSHAAAPKLPICAELKRLNKDGVIAITYSGLFDMDALGAKSQPIQPAPSSADVFDDLNKLRVIGPMAVSLALSDYPPPVVPQATAGDSRFYWLQLQKVRSGTLTVIDQQGDSLSTTRILVPSDKPGEAWSLPAPKAQPFGNSTFVLAVAESGAVTSVEYGKTAGAPGVMNVLSAAATAATPKSAADKLAELKTQDDMIAENNRHAKCLAQPDQCS